MFFRRGSRPWRVFTAIAENRTIDLMDLVYKSDNKSDKSSNLEVLKVKSTFKLKT